MPLVTKVLLCLLAFPAYGRRVARIKTGSQQEMDKMVTDVIPTTDAASQKGKDWNPRTSFEEFFEKEFKMTKEQTAKLWDHFRKSGMKTDQFPFRDHAQSLKDSMKNWANRAKDEVKAAVVNAGGNPDGDISPEVCSTAESALTKRPTAEGNGNSLVETGAANPFGATPYGVSSVDALASTMNMMASSVATNTAAVAGLTAAVGSNSAALAQLGGTVSVMSQVTGPTMALATTLGVSSGTVATLALAGSFVGPLVGVIALIYVTWPEEEIDPWLKIEERVSQMITDKFDAVRRQRLGDRMRRYVRQFAQCSKAWVATVMVKKHGVALPKWIVQDAKAALASGSDFSLPNREFKAENVPPPACMQELEGHMSLERDEWFVTEEGKMGGLFMPFANMHTQMLMMLADHPYDDKMEWRSTLKSTAAEYGAYMLKHTIGAWKAQVCRTMRLRQSVKVSEFGWKYQWIVLKPVYQPNAAQDCSAKCDGKSGWCGFCGGKNVGACCKRGDTSDPICERFDTPLIEGIITNSMPSVCVHTDCIQSNTAYYGEELKKVDGDMTAQDCQTLCQDLAGAVAFTSTDKTCSCYSAKDLARKQADGVNSGPTVCGKPDDSVSAREERFQDQLKEGPVNAPMEEIEPCAEKSPAVSDYPSAEKDHADWVKQCLSKATGEVTKEFNTFFKRIGKSLDSMAWSAGCGAQRATAWDQGGWNSVNQDFDMAESSAGTVGSFANCDWNNQEEMDKKTKTWSQGEERARGWTGTSKVDMDAQKNAKIGFPMPTWLADLTRQLPCLEDSAAGKVKDNSDGRATAVNTMMESVSMNVDGEM